MVKHIVQPEKLPPTLPWTTGSKWHSTLIYLPCSLIAFHPMINSLWVTLHLFNLTMQSHFISSHDQQDVSNTALVFLDYAVSLHFIPWPTACEWHYFCFSWPSSHIVFDPMTNSMWVTCICFSWPCSLIAFHPMTNREWVTLHLFSWPCAFHPMTNSQWVTLVFLDHAVSLHCIPWSTACEWYCSCVSWPCTVSLHFILWSTGCEWHWICFSRLCSLIAFHLMTNSQWVTLHLIFLTIQSYCIWSHDQQYVSDTAFIFFDHEVSLHFIPWPTGCEWHWICSSWPCSLIAFHPMTNSEWVAVHFTLFNAV